MNLHDFIMYIIKVFEFCSIYIQNYTNDFKEQMSVRLCFWTKL